MDQIAKSYRILSKHLPPPGQCLLPISYQTSYTKGTKQKDPSFGKIASCFISNVLCRFFFPLKGHFIQVVATWVFFVSIPSNPTQKRPGLAPFEGYSSMRSRYSPGSCVELRRVSISLENSRVDPGRFHTPKVLGGLVQMILRIWIGWFLGEPAINFPGCTLSFSGCVVVSQISNQLARVTGCHQSFFFQKLYSKETVGHFCWILLLATGKYQADFDRVY